MDRTAVRTRYAPSPTGYMHVGNLRTALYEYLIAKSQGGTFILRIEDTDQKRLVGDAVDVIYRTLKMVGLRHDEGPDIGGPAGPYVQSQRKDLYRRRAEELVAKGAAYYCFCGRDTADEDGREDSESETAVFGYNRRCRGLPEAEAARQLADGVPHVIRQKMPLTGTTTFIDAVYGLISVENKELEDQVLLKSDGFPTYNFANVVDDHEMGITHIVRGSEYLPSTPKYSLLYEAFGWEIPVYVHLPLITGKDGKKLSKRHGSTSLEVLVGEGFLPQAIVNYIALLGWSPAGTREIFNLDDLCSEFSISGISKSPSVFDYDKLRWFNAEYLRAMGRDEFLALIRPRLDEVFAGKPHDGELLAEMLQPRVVQLTQVKDMVDFLSVRQDYSLDLYHNQKSKATPDLARVVLPAVISQLSALQDWSRTALHDLLVQAAAGMGLKTGQLLWPVRIAVSGREVTPGGAIEILAILGKDESLERLETARQRIGPAQQA
jgi:glutamyl-tRNA synthetase